LAHGCYYVDTSSGSVQNFSTYIKQVTFRCAASCTQLKQTEDWRGALGSTSPASPAPSGPLPGATFVNGVRPSACKTPKECFNRRIEVFQVSLTGTQTTDWTVSRHLSHEGQVCDTTGGGNQTITLKMAPQPTALWTENGRVIGTPATGPPVGQL